ncbi:MAG: RNA 2',3'-cyclic phosphodiesterase [Patescibacteria group bacterium]
MRRLFIAINIPEEIKDRIAGKNDSLEVMLPDARYTGRNNWHLTIVFLGYQPDEMIVPIIESMKAVVKKFQAPEIVLSDISYGSMEGSARMIWLNGSKETSKLISPLKTFLEDELIKNKARFKLENRAFNAHVTLNRFADIPKKDLPELGKEFKDLNWLFEAESLDLMESRPSSKGAKYEILQKINFKTE